MTAPSPAPQSFVWFPWPTGGAGWPPFPTSPFPPPILAGGEPTRGLTPLDPNSFPNGNGQSGTDPVDPAPAPSGAFSAAELDVLRQAAGLVAAARRDARSGDKAVAKAAKRRLSVLSAYVVGFLEAKGRVQLGTLVAGLRPSAAPDYDKAAEELTKLLDDVVANPDGTRFLPVLLAGVVIGILVDRAVDNLTS